MTSQANGDDGHRYSGLGWVCVCVGGGGDITFVAVGGQYFKDQVYQENLKSTPNLTGTTIRQISSLSIKAVICKISVPLNYGLL